MGKSLLLHFASNENWGFKKRVHLIVYRPADRSIYGQTGTFIIK